MQEPTIELEAAAAFTIPGAEAVRLPLVLAQIECSLAELKEGNTRYRRVCFTLPGSAQSARCVVVERTRLGPGFVPYKAGPESAKASSAQALTGCPTRRRSQSRFPSDRDGKLA